MTIVSCMNAIVNWTNREVCSKIKFKIPDDDRNDSSYEEEYINPSVFPLYLPTKDRLPPNILAVHPSICIQLVEGKELPVENKGTIQLRFCLSTWNPGEHSAEIFEPIVSENNMPTYSKGNSGENFARNNDGWIDIANFVDVLMSTLINAEFTDGIRLIKEDGVQYGTFKEDNNIVDFYPYWFMWMECSFEYGAERKAPDSYAHLL